MDNREEYNEVDTPCKKYNIPVAEQETHIVFMRDEDFARIYTSDSTMMTRLDKLCNTAPDTYSLVEDTGSGKRYRCSDKTLISFRSKKRELSDEQREAASERMKRYQNNRHSQPPVFADNPIIQI